MGFSLFDTATLLEGTDNGVELTLVIQLPNERPTRVPHYSAQTSQLMDEPTKSPLATFQGKSLPTAQPHSKPSVFLWRPIWPYLQQEQILLPNRQKDLLARSPLNWYSHRQETNKWWTLN